MIFKFTIQSVKLIIVHQVNDILIIKIYSLNIIHLPVCGKYYHLSCTSTKDILLLSRNGNMYIKYVNRSSLSSISQKLSILCYL